jgi:hypothetical protein
VLVKSRVLRDSNSLSPTSREALLTSLSASARVQGIKGRIRGRHNPHALSNKESRAIRQHEMLLAFNKQCKDQFKLPVDLMLSRKAPFCIRCNVLSIACKRSCNGCRIFSTACTTLCANKCVLSFISISVSSFDCTYEALIVLDLKMECTWKLLTSVQGSPIQRKLTKTC